MPFRPAVFASLFVLVISNLVAQQAASPNVTSPSGTQITVVPSRGLRNGKAFDISIAFPECDASIAYTLTPLTGSGITIGKTATEGVPPFCQTTASLTIGTTAAIGSTKLYLRDNKQKLVATVLFEIVDTAPGPIPPGLSPQVDVMWKVLPNSVTQDAFGGWAKKRYYAVEVVIGNNTGYQLQLASLGFLFRNPDGSVREDVNDGYSKSPTNDYRMVRTTLEKEQTDGSRAVWFNILSAATAIAPGGAQFFSTAHAIAKANYTQGVSLAAGPLAKGLTAIFPDHTVAQLNHLDNTALRNNTVIQNNSQTTVVTFVSREMLASFFYVPKSKTKDMNLSIQPCAGSTQTRTLRSGLTHVVQTSPATQSVPQSHCNPDDPTDAKYWLGRLVLIGDTVTYLNRVQVVSAPTEATQKTTAIDPIDFDTSSLTTGAPFTLTGEGLDKLPTSIPDVGGNLSMTFDVAETDTTTRKGKLLFASGKTEKDVTLGRIAVKIDQSGGTIPVTVWGPATCTAVAPLKMDKSTDTAEVILNCGADTKPSPQVSTAGVSVSTACVSAANQANPNCLVFKVDDATKKQIVPVTVEFPDKFHRAIVSVELDPGS